MRKTITHNGVDIEILKAYETPQVQCNAGDLFIRENEEGTFWVSHWDGKEAWDCGTEPAATLEEAIAWAKEWAENCMSEDE